MNQDPRVNVIVQNQEGGRLPGNELDFQMMMVDGRWGDPNIDSELKNRLKSTRFIKVKAGSVLTDAQGVETVLQEDAIIPTEEFLWSELSWLTRDFRLGHLDKNDFLLATHYSNLAADCLRLNMRQAFAVCLSRVAVLLELSQSKNGFLRNLVGKRHVVSETTERIDTPNLILPKRGR